jgi:hypothetical protein
LTLHEHPPTLLSPDILHAERADRQQIVPADSPYYLSCFVQTVSSTNASVAGVSRVLVMKVASFSPPGIDYTDAWTNFLASAETCLSQQFDLVVVRYHVVVCCLYNIALLKLPSLLSYFILFCNRWM